MAEYEFLGPVWNKQTVNWYWAGLDDRFAVEIRKAFQAWDQIIALDFAEVRSTSAADIVLRWQYIDGPAKVLGNTNSTYTLGANSHFLSSNIVFDSSESWTWSAPRSTYVTGASSTFYELALHEIGHAIGLDHVSNSGAVMYNLITGAAQNLTTGDIRGAQALYGAEKATSVESAWAGATKIYGSAGNDVLNSDTSNGFFDTASGQVVRLYQATLARLPDSGGHAVWTAQVMAGVPLASIVSGFTSSAEFQAKYGQTTNETFVTLLYRNVLGREPDSGGFADWLGGLRGGLSRESVVLGFSESAEFKIASAPQSLQFSFAAKQADWTDEVVRLYHATLDRLPDLNGFNYWTHELARGVDFGSVVSGFTNSTEFRQVYGALSNTAFVTLLYSNVLDRAPDAAGLAGWVGTLNSGIQSRENVVQGFSESYEFRTKMAPAIEGWIESLGTDDYIEGGAGNDALLGGLYADVFKFSFLKGGKDTVVGFEAWDTIALQGFGFSSKAAAAAAFYQDQSDAVFAYTNGEIRLIDTLASALTADEFILI